jgi:hypothetical protein
MLSRIDAVHRVVDRGRRHRVQPACGGRADVLIANRLHRVLDPAGDRVAGECRLRQQQAHDAQAGDRCVTNAKE